MKIIKITADKYKVMRWAHGDSRELYIYPENSQFSERNFDWRVSTASVEMDGSTFTTLYGVKRWIMPFDSNMTLKHSTAGKPLYNINLKPYEPHCFKGGWDTTSGGKGKDFNLLLRNDTDGILKHLSVPAGEWVFLGEAVKEAFDERLGITEKHATIGIYTRKADFVLTSDGDETTVLADEMVLIEYGLSDFDKVRETKILNRGTEPADLSVFIVAY